MHLAIKRYLFSLLLCLALTDARVQADELMIATAAVPPWGLLGEAYQPAGLLIDFQNELARRAGLRFATKLSPYPRVIHDLASGNADLGVMFVSRQAKQVGISLGEVVVVGIVALMPAAAPSVSGVADFAGLRVGYVRGSKYGPDFDDNSTFEHVPVTSPEQGLRMLTIDRLDVMVATEQALAFGLYKSGIPAGNFKLALQVGVTRADLYVTRHQARATWVPAVRRALTAMREAGTLRQLFYGHKLWPATVACFSADSCLAAREPEFAAAPEKEVK